MALERQKFYFFPPTRETPPSTTIKLGNIITLPRNADEPLNSPPLPIDTTTMEVFEHEIKDYKVTIDHSATNTIGIWASFLMQILGLGGDVGGEHSNTDKEEWKCESLKTVWFTPSPAYIVKSLENSAVKEFLKENRNWLSNSKVYMITGIKIAYGASGVIVYAKKKGLNLHLGVNATNLGVPVEGGPNFGVTRERSVTEEIGGKEPFVLAFRMRRIKVSSKGDVENKIVTGGMLSLGSDEEGEEPVRLVVDGVEDEDADADEFEIENSWNIKEDGDTAMSEPIACAMSLEL